MRHKSTRVVVLMAMLIALLLFWSRKPVLPKFSYVQAADESGSATQYSRTETPHAQKVLGAQDEVLQEGRRKVIEGVMASLAAPIEFYGKVVDQQNDPVVDAEILYSTLDKFDSSGSTYRGRSDAAGLFSIKGISGAVLNVGVRKAGYYPIDEKSTGIFAYGVGVDDVRKRPPNQKKPAIFVLHKMGQVEPLVHFEGYFKISRTGEPLEVNLETGKLGCPGDLKVEAWTDDLQSQKRVRYNWKCRLSVPGGGLLERVNEFQFEAPQQGYRESIEIDMPQDAQPWVPEIQKSFFVKLADGHYARVQFRMIAQGNHYFGLESYYNPTLGARNLEFDPAKVIKP